MTCHDQFLIGRECEVSYKVRWNYYKLWQLSWVLQSAMDSCYKLRHLFSNCLLIFFKFLYLLIEVISSRSRTVQKWWIPRVKRRCFLCVWMLYYFFVWHITCAECTEKKLSPWIKENFNDRYLRVHPHLFANRQIEQPNIYKSLVFLEIHH